MPGIIDEIGDLARRLEPGEVAPLWYNSAGTLPMAILTASKLAMSFGAEDVFWNISVSVPHGARIALVGPNGAGKTTLIRILVGLESPTSGEVHRARNCSVGYLLQEAELALEDRGQTVWGEMLGVFDQLRAQEQALRAMEDRMGAPGANGAPSLMEQYGAALERFELEGGYEYELRIRQVLEGLGLGSGEHEKPVGHLSGGQKARALLAKLLLRSPDLLVLDEPTNHLDIEALEWLESWLINWGGSLLIVSHDRYLLDRVANRVWELDYGQIQTYRGNYSAYVQQRAERRERRLAEYKAQQAFMAKEEDFIRRYVAGQRSREAKGRRTRLERLKRDGLLVRPVDDRHLQLRFGAARRSGDIVLQTKDLVVGYAPEAPLFRADDIDLRRTERAALIGPNGCGKTTFLKTVLGALAPLGGELRLGASLEAGYFAQARTDLHMDSRVLDELLRHHPMPTGEARGLLARFLLVGDDVFKPVRALSGGERSRLALAILMKQAVNFLLLDEPANHLDIPSQEVLESVLGEFGGTILLVTHDRYLVSRLATQIWTLEANRLRVFYGGYDEYLSAREPGEEPAATAQADRSGKTRRVGHRAGSRPAGQRRGSRAGRRAVSAADLEQGVSELETRLTTLSAQLEAAVGARQFDKVRLLGLEYRQVEEDLERRMAEWAEAAAVQGEV